MNVVIYYVVKSGTDNTELKSKKAELNNDKDLNNLKKWVSWFELQDFFLYFLRDGVVLIMNEHQTNISIEELLNYEWVDMGKVKQGVIEFSMFDSNENIYWDSIDYYVTNENELELLKAWVIERQSQIDFFRWSDKNLISRILTHNWNEDA